MSHAAVCQVVEADLSLGYTLHVNWTLCKQPTVSYWGMWKLVIPLSGLCWLGGGLVCDVFRLYVYQSTWLTQWLRRPPWERKILGLNPACSGIFLGLSHTSDLKISTPVATLPGAWHYRISAGTGWPSVSTLWLGEMESLICNFYLSLAAHKLEIHLHVAGTLSNLQANKPYVYHRMMLQKCCCLRKLL